MKPKKKKKQPSDINRLAKSILDEATSVPSDKNPHAQALGRLGGLKGGPARARKLSREERVRIAKAAIAARWLKK